MRNRILMMSVLAAVGCGSSDGVNLPGGGFTGVGVIPDAGGGGGGPDSGNTPDGALPQQPKLNEIVFNDPIAGGADTNEYIEIYGAPNTDYSTLFVLEIDGDDAGGDDAGDVLSVHQVGTTDANGFWDTGVLANSSLQNGSGTFLLVSAFTGAVTDDLDVADTGAFTSTPWTEILDSVAFDDESGSNLFYVAGTGATLAVVAGASRFPDGVDTDAVGDWLPNNPDGATNATEADNTRGAANTTGP